MEKENKKAIAEAILFASGEEIPITKIMAALELSKEEATKLLEEMQEDYQNENRGIELIKVNGYYQLATKKEYYNYLYPIFDKRGKPTLSNASMETLAIIAYNPNITRAEIESIRGVSSDGIIYKLMEYGLIEVSGKADLPGKPTVYAVTKNFMKLFDLSTLEDLPELPRYKVNENHQIVLDELEPNNSDNSINSEEENDKSEKEDTENNSNEIKDEIEEEIDNNNSEGE